jgi:hypothetical protein
MTKSINILSSLILILMMVVGCNEDDNNIICYEFDQRSCQGDEWGALLSEFNTWEEKLSTLSIYMKGRGINVISLEVDEDFHEVVCLACVVCPDGPRFYMEVEAGNLEELEKLDLLNFQLSDCS